MDENLVTTVRRGWSMASPEQRTDKKFREAWIAIALADKQSWEQDWAELAFTYWNVQGH
jgi:hypothetical protein